MIVSLFMNCCSLYPLVIPAPEKQDGDFKDTNINGGTRKARSHAEVAGNAGITGFRLSELSGLCVHHFFNLTQNCNCIILLFSRQVLV